MNRDEILAQLASGEITPEEASKLLDEIEQQKQSTLYCKVSQKARSASTACSGCPSPSTSNSGSGCSAFADDIQAFMKQHDSELKRKNK